MALPEAVLCACGLDLPQPPRLLGVKVREEPDLLWLRPPRHCGQVAWAYW